MKTVITAMALSMLASTAICEVNTSTHLIWLAPKEHVSGKPINQPIMYRIYVCESEVRDDYTCDKKITTYDTPADVDQYVVNHQTESNDGMLYIRMSAVIISNGQEGPLSNQIIRKFDSLDPPKAPTIDIAITVIQK